MWKASIFFLKNFILEIFFTLQRLANGFEFPNSLNASTKVSTRRMQCAHRYLMSRLSLQVFYLWRHVLSTQRPPFILWWSILEILFVPLHRSSPFIGGLRCQAIQTEHGPFIAERIQKAVYIVRCLWMCRIKAVYSIIKVPFKILSYS
jgi:hypothetical protein